MEKLHIGSIDDSEPDFPQEKWDGRHMSGMMTSLNDPMSFVLKLAVFMIYSMCFYSLF